MRGRWKDKISQLHPFLGARVEGVDLAEVTKEEILSTFAPLLEELGKQYGLAQDVRSAIERALRHSNQFLACNLGPQKGCQG